MKFLQLNLGRGKDAQDLLIKTARERGADVLLISEQYYVVPMSSTNGPKILLGIRMHQGWLASLSVALI